MGYWKQENNIGRKKGDGKEEGKSEANMREETAVEYKGKGEREAKRRGE